MDVYRTGAQKNYGTKKLITSNGKAIRPSKYLNRWEADRAEFVFFTTGVDFRSSSIESRRNV